MTLDVSVVIPVFDGARFLAEAIESALGQTLAAAEVIVVDDASSDTSARIAEGFGGRVRVLRHEVRGGPARARNSGIGSARAALVALLDADDRMIRDRLAFEAAFLEANPDVDGLVPRVATFSQSAAELPRWALNPNTGEPFTHTLGSPTVRRATFERVGTYDPEYAFGFDVEWLVRARGMGARIEPTEHVGIERRIHDANVTPGRIESGRSRRDIMAAVRASLARRKET